MSSLNNIYYASPSEVTLDYKENSNNNNLPKIHNPKKVLKKEKLETVTNTTGGTTEWRSMNYKIPNRRTDEEDLESEIESVMRKIQAISIKWVAVIEEWDLLKEEQSK